MARQLIDDLIDKPFNELTEEEAEVVIEWKAKKQFEQFKHEAQFEAMQQMVLDSAKEHKKQTEEAAATMEELKQRALAFYEAQ